MNSAVAALLVFALSAEGFSDLEPGIQVRETVVSRSGSPMQLWLYRPAKVDASSRLPLVLVAPAGSLLVTGMELGKEDRVEHLPYVRAGFAVAAFSLDGPVKGESNADVIQAVRSFQGAHAGVDNARAALEAAAKALPIDSSRIYAAGHSSAGTLALLLAAEDSRVKGVAAYAPVTVIRSFNPELLAIFERVPGYARFIDASTPDLRSSDIKVPVFLFTVDGDPVVSADSVVAFAAKLGRTNKRVTLIHRSGAHVASDEIHFGTMIQDGLPTGVKWLKALDDQASPPPQRR